VNILLTNVGRRTYFVDFLLEINKKENIKIHLSDCDLRTPSFYHNKKCKTHITPKVKNNKSNYLSSLIKLVKTNKINLIIPLSDLDLEILSDNINKFQKLKCFIAISNSKVIKTCYDKIKLLSFCKKYQINYPKLFFNKNDIRKFPIIKKEIKGSGSKGLKKIFSKKEMIGLNEKNFVFQELIKGNEYNVDIFNDLNGRYVSCCIKKKLLMRAGETDKCEVVDNSKIEKFSIKISKTLKHVGNLDCDIIMNGDKINLIDLNPRFGGGYPFTHLSGLKYVSALIKMYKGKKYQLIKKPKKIIGMKSISLQYYPKN